MSKIYMIGDYHLGLGYPNKTDKWLKVHKEYFNNFLLPLLIREVSEYDMIALMGDLFDNRDVIPIELLNYGMDIVEQLSKIAPTHVIIGNHDLWSKSASEVNSIRPFRYIPNVYVYDKPTKIVFNNLNILMMPFYEKKKEQLDVLKAHNDCQYLLCHSDLNGAKMHLTSVAHKNKDKIDVDEFSSFKRVLSGHIHLVQHDRNFTFVGSIFQMDRNDRDNQKGIFVLDTNTNDLAFFPNKISPVFKQVKVYSERDFEALDSLKGSKDYIDLAISNSLLINNRKLRRKLESVLESGNFASVEYIDDIIREEAPKEEVEVINEELTNISIQLDYGDTIRDYITHTYKDDKLKSGLLTEFEEVLDLYDKGYKKS